MFSVVVTPGGGRPVQTQNCPDGFIGKKRFFILGNADKTTIQFTSNDSTSVVIYGAAWEGYFTTRNQGIG